MRYYLDYNSTCPLQPQVIEELKSLIDFDSNPSSQHRRGKTSSKLIHDVEFFLKKFFHLNKANLVFHSGATEFFNTIFNLAPGDTLCFAQGDHSAIHAIADSLQSKGVNIIKVPSIDDSVIDKLSGLEGKVWLNFQWMNNETGEISPLSLARKIKQETGCLVHVDAVQTVGKIADFQQLDSSLDCYTYSGHKFGALKGVGFSFLLSDLKLTPLIVGGGQQNGYRSGTLNTHGIMSLKWALENRDFSSEFSEVRQFKQEIENIINGTVNWSFISNDSANTLCLLHESEKSDALLVHFDLAGLDVSTGSACTSGSLKPSQTLLAKNIDSKYALQNIRLSLGAGNLKDRDIILTKLKDVAEKL